MSDIKEVKIVYFGLTGQGKSTNGCFVLKKPDAFKVGNSAKGETNFCTLGENVIPIGDKKYKVSILDTLGLGAEDTKGGLSEDDCIIKIKEGLDQHKDVRCIALIHNCTIVRMTNDENKMLNIYIRMLPPQEIWKNICIIYSNFDCSKDEEEKKEIIDKLNNPNGGFTYCFTEKLKEAIELRNKELPDLKKIDTRNMNGQIKTFFMDSRTKNLEKNKLSVEESHKFIEWASECQFLDLNAVSLIITKKIPEEDEYLLSCKDEGNYAIKTYISRKREKKINKLGKISYSEWVDIPTSKREIKEELKYTYETHNHDLKKEYEEDKYLVKCYQSKRRKVYIKSDGTKKPDNEWEYFGDVEHDKQPLKTYYKQTKTKLKETKYVGKKEIKFYQRRHKKVYIHQLSNKDYESSQSSDEGSLFSQEKELTPISTSFETEKRRIIKCGSYERIIKKGNLGLIAGGAAVSFIPVIGWIPGLAMTMAGGEKKKTIYRYKQEIYKRKISEYSTGFIEKGEWMLDNYDYFSNSDPEYDRKY